MHDRASLVDLRKRLPMSSIFHSSAIFRFVRAALSALLMKGSIKGWQADIVYRVQNVFAGDHDFAPVFR